LARETKESVTYDFKTAVTFLLIGVGLGALAAIMWSPRSVQFSGIERSHEREGETIFDS